jgi:hypothetical protein
MTYKFKIHHYCPNISIPELDILDMKSLQFRGKKFIATGYHVLSAKLQGMKHSTRTMAPRGEVPHLLCGLKMLHEGGDP